MPRPDPSPAPQTRVGLGYELHRLEPDGRPLVLGGVRLEHDLGPISHSDGDALLHAITDAILGALALPDIGELFPDTDPANEGRDSAEFLAEALRLAADAGWAVGNVDAAIILQRPKLSPHKARIRQSLSRLLDLPPDRVNVKGKTHEGVDALGQGRAVEVHAAVLLHRTPA
jgi:2-C-methyl-D-erythritol 2,4-cyclodiphosphate synthase